MTTENTNATRIECGFGCTPAIKYLLTAMAVIPMMGLIALFCSYAYVDVSAVGSLVVFVSCCAIMLAGLIIYLKLGKGTITADEKSVDVSYGFLSRTIPLSEIENVRCEVETEGTRYGDVIYTMFLLIETKDGRSYRYQQELPIEKDYPAKHPEEYRAYLESQPMRKLSEFIKKRV